MNEEILTKTALEEVTAVGFCALTSSPVEGQPALRYAVSLMLKLSDAVLKTIADKPTPMYFQHYRTANAVLDAAAFRIMLICAKRTHLAGKRRRREKECPVRNIAVM